MSGVQGGGCLQFPKIHCSICVMQYMHITCYGGDNILAVWGYISKSKHDKKCTINGAFCSYKNLNNIFIDCRLLLFSVVITLG